MTIPYGTLEALLGYSPGVQKSRPPRAGAAEDPPGEASDDALAELLGDKVRTLVDVLASIDEDVAVRGRVSSMVLGDIVREYCYLKTKLYELDTWSLGANRSVEGRRTKLEAMLQQLNQETRQEMTTKWQDIAALRREQRTWLKQYRDLLQRVALAMGTPRGR